MANKAQELTNYDKITRYYESPEDNPLDESLRKIYNRWKVIYSLLMNGRPTKSVVAIIKKDFAPISTATVYNDVNDVMFFYGNLNKASVEFRRHFLWEHQVDTLMKAKAINDFKAENAAIKNLMEIAGLKDHIKDIIDPDDLGGNIYQMAVYIDNSQTATIFNIDEPETIPLQARQKLLAALKPVPMTAEEMLTILKNHVPDTSTEA